MQKLPVEGKPNRRTEYSKEKEKCNVQKGGCDDWRWQPPTIGTNEWARACGLQRKFDGK